MPLDLPDSSWRPGVLLEEPAQQGAPPSAAQQGAPPSAAQQQTAQAAQPYTLPAQPQLMPQAPPAQALLLAPGLRALQHHKPSAQTNPSGRQEALLQAVRSTWPSQSAADRLKRKVAKLLLQQEPSALGHYMTVQALGQQLTSSGKGAMWRQQQGLPGLLKLLQTDPRFHVLQARPARLLQLQQQLLRPLPLASEVWRPCVFLPSGDLLQWAAQLNGIGVAAAAAEEAGGANESEEDED